jgi:hypothetical protein
MIFTYTTLRFTEVFGGGLGQQKAAQVLQKELAKPNKSPSPHMPSADIQTHIKRHKQFREVKNKT